MLLVTQVAPAAERLVIGVENQNWDGHYYWENGELKGVDADIVRAAAKRVGIQVEFKPYPWKRVIYLAQEKQLDGVLELAPTKQREAFLHFVSTPLSVESVVFWVVKGSPFSFDGTLPSGLKLGLMRGYDWSDRFAMHGTPQVVRFDSHELAFKNLEAGRIDCFGGYLRPTMILVDKLGYTGKIVPSVPYLDDEGLDYYFALTHKPGHKELAQKFAEAFRELFATTYARYSPLKK